MSLLGLRRAGSGPILVWLHGFTQTKDSGHEFLSILAGTHEVLTIDLPGHGQNAAVAASLDETADLLADALPIGPFALGGYSYGGRVALHFALAYPERVSRLILLSATMGIRSPSERRARRERDEALADHIEASDIDEFLDEWLGQTLFATLPADPVERTARSRDVAGLAASLRLSGTGTQAWLGDRLSTLNVPTLIVVGGGDVSYVAEAQRLRAAVANSRVALVDGAGHAAHLERPAAVAQLVAAF